MLMEHVPPPLCDEELAESVKRGEKNAFGAIVERYEKKLLRYGNKFLSDGEDVKDIVQDVFMSVYQNIRSFDGAQRFSPWVYRIAHNAFVNGLKKKSRNPFVFLDFDALLAHTVYKDPAEDEREQKEMRTMIDKGLNAIPQKYKEILILYYLEEIPYKEIADILKIPVGTVGIRLKRAKSALRNAYAKMNINTIAQ
jgi:RNA polymerase sigma-70 factor (ECF subfamily)